MTLALTLPDEIVEAVARRAAELVVEYQRLESEPWMNTKQAAAYLACKPQRLHELSSLERIAYRKDGSRNLYRRSDLDRYLDDSG